MPIWNKVSYSIFRAWFYFRIGYSTYFTFLLGYFSTFVTIYYLAIRNLPTLLTIFPSFLGFLATGSVVGGPACIAAGYLHYKRSKAWRSEVEIQAEMNPYYFKVQAGYNRIALMPAWIALLNLTKRLAQKENLLTEEERKEIDDLQQKFATLRDGGMLGRPKTMDDTV